MAGNVTDLPDLSTLDARDSSALVDILTPFTTSSKSAFSFAGKAVSDRRQFTDSLLNIINDLLEMPEDHETVMECLSALVIMSRDAQSISGAFNTKRSWDNLTFLAGWRSKCEDNDKVGCYNTKLDIVLLCLKCMSNLLYLTQDQNGFCDDAEFLEQLICTLSNTNHRSTDLEFLLVRLIFLITAFNESARKTIVSEFEGRKVLCDILTLRLSQCVPADSHCSTLRAILPEHDAKSCCEIFKTLFNMNMKSEQGSMSEVVVNEFNEITRICYKFLLTRIGNDDDYTSRFHVDVQNCLYSVALPNFNDLYFVPLLPEMLKDDVFSHMGYDIPIIDERDLSAVQVILQQLENKLNATDPSTEYLVPVLSLLSVMSRSSRIVRKYCKKCIIPPRKDFKDRPEMGSKLRNKLIKLFTHASTEIKGSAADFIFVLCKENVDRLVKHTGYGNAAGLLASRGLLAGGGKSTAYSDTDSDSDTEEYRENVDKINPITGHIQPEMPDPMENMSDEQKEYLAVQLANELTKLSSNDVIKPVCVDPNTGKLVSLQQKFHETVLPEEKNSDDDDSD